MNGFQNDRLHSPGTGDSPERFERLVLSITAAAAPELERRRRRQSLILQFDDWRRPVMSAAAVMILIFGSLFLSSLQRAQDVSGDTPLIVEAVLPNPLSLWLETGAQPTLVEVLRAFEEERR